MADVSNLKVSPTEKRIDCLVTVKDFWSGKQKLKFNLRLLSPAPIKKDPDDLAEKVLANRTNWKPTKKGHYSYYLDNIGVRAFILNLEEPKPKEEENED